MCENWSVLNGEVNVVANTSTNISNYMRPTGGHKNENTKSESEEKGILQVVTKDKVVWKSISVGKNHAVLISSNNQTWSVGYGASGQLGLSLCEIYNLQNLADAADAS